MTRSLSILSTRPSRVLLRPAGAWGTGPKQQRACTEFGRTSRNRASEPRITRRREHSWPELIAAAPVINKRSGGLGTKELRRAKGSRLDYTHSTRSNGHPPAINVIASTRDIAGAVGTQED